MHLIAGIDEFATQTQVSEGWTYAVLSAAAVSAINAAVASYGITEFHGSQFQHSQADSYEALLTATRAELAKDPQALLTFTLLDLSWKAEFLGLVSRLITGSTQKAGISDSVFVAAADHLFPGLATLQRLTTGLHGATIDIEMDADDHSRRLLRDVLVKGKAISGGALLGIAYEAYRKLQFPDSPSLGLGGICAREGVQSRAVQVADVVGNFALSYIFVQLGQSSATRRVKADILQRVFGLDPGPIAQAVALSGPTNSDIKVLQPGGFTLKLSL